MVRWLRFGAAMLLALTMCAAFGRVLTLYHQPMEDAVYDLSLNWQGEAIPEDWVYDQKGWTVFTQEGETRKELTPDGQGGFTGLDRPGQTIYFSRIIQEDLDSPTLRLDPAEKTLAVFLDGKLLYTDCPQQDNRVGFLHLPIMPSYREDALLIQLPLPRCPTRRDWLCWRSSSGRCSRGGSIRFPSAEPWRRFPISPPASSRPVSTRCILTCPGSISRGWAGS